MASTPDGDCAYCAVWPRAPQNRPWLWYDASSRLQGQYLCYSNKACREVLLDQAEGMKQGKAEQNDALGNKI